MTDFQQLARDTLTASEKASSAPWVGKPGLVQAGGLRLHGFHEDDAEFIALMRTVGPLLAQHVLDLREAVEQARGHLNVGSEAWEILDAALAEKEASQ